MSYLVALAGVFALAACLYLVVRGSVRMAAESGKKEGEDRLRAAQEEDARRRLKNVLDADARSRADVHAGRLLDDDGYRRD